MELPELLMFLHIVRHGSLLKAAAALRVSQPTASLRIRTLERHIGARLFTRTHEGMELTQAGTLLIPFAERIIQLTNEGLATIHTSIGQARLRIASIESIAGLLLPEVLIRLRHDVPDLDVKLVTGQTDEVIHMVLDGAVNLGLIGNRRNYAGLQRLEILSAPVTCVVAKEHPLLTLPGCGLSDLVKYPIMIYQWQSDLAGFESALKTRTRDTIRVWRILPLEAFRRLIELGAVGFIPDFHVRREVRTGQFGVLPLADMPTGNYHAAIVLRPTTRQDVVVSRFLKLMSTLPDVLHSWSPELQRLAPPDAIDPRVRWFPETQRLGSGPRQQFPETPWTISAEFGSRDKRVPPGGR